MDHTIVDEAKSSVTTDVGNSGYTFHAVLTALAALTEESQKKVLDFTMGLIRTEQNNPFISKTEKEFLESIDKSIMQAEYGRKKDAFESFDAITTELENRNR